MENSGGSNFDFSNIANPEDIKSLAGSEEQTPTTIVVDSKGTIKDVNTGEMTDKFGNRIEAQPSSQNVVDRGMLQRETELNPPIQNVVDSFDKGQPTGSFVTIKNEDTVVKTAEQISESSKRVYEKLRDENDPNSEIAKKADEILRKNYPNESAKQEAQKVSDFRKALNELRGTYEPHSEIVKRESVSDERLDKQHREEASKTVVTERSNTTKSTEKASKKASIDPKVLEQMKKLGEMNSLDQLTKRIPETNEAGDFGAIAPDKKVENKAENEGKETDMQIVLREIHGKLEKNAPLDRSERVILQLMISNMVTIKTENRVDVSVSTLETQPVVKPTGAVIEQVEATNKSGTTTTQTQEIKSEQTEKKGGFRDWLKRNKTRIACIAGGLATGAVAALNHIPYVASGAMLLGAASGVSTRLLSYLYNKDLEKLKATTDENERKILREKMLGKEKKMKILGYVGTFLGGVVVGNFATNFIASRIPSGPTDTTATPEAGNSTPVESQPEVAQTNTSTPTVETTSTQTSSSIPTTETVTTSTQTTTSVPTETVNIPTATPEVTGNGVLLSNGRVNLPGSAWNGNLAGNAVGNLQGGELNYSNYAGGWHEMAPKMLENDLISAGINRDTLLGNLSTADIHRLINGYLSDIQSGVRGATNPDLLTNLGKLGTEGAQNLINIIQGR